jgi:hypothetical protein
MSPACGLWFHKQKCPRPKEKWQRVSKARRKRGGKGAAKPPKKLNGPPNPRSDAPTPASDDSSPADTSTEAPDGYDQDDDLQGLDDEMTDNNEPQLPPMPRQMRANSLGPNAQGLRRAQTAQLSQRQVQSSPTKGTEHDLDHTEADLTPKPLRRQLFPSPNKPLSAPGSTHGSVQAQRLELLPSFVRRSPRLTKTKDVFQVPGIAGAVALTADGKENVLPEAFVDHAMSLDDLFDMVEDEPILPPSTPQRRSERLTSKTPQRSFGNELSSNALRSPGLRTPKAKQAQHPVATALLGSVVKDVADMTPFTRNVHEALHGQYILETLTPQRLKKTNKRVSPPKNVAFEFPDLPSLQGSSPSNNDNFFNVNFSELPTDIQTDLSMFSTDAPMPSSPPTFFQFINSDGENDHTIDDWGQVQDQHGVKSAYNGHGDNDIGSGQTPRRSPRNKQ